MRTIVEIPDEQLAPLAELCQQEHISRAEAIRRALAMFLDRHTRDVDSAFGMWKDRRLDGVEYQRALRGEWGG
jgi:metal-responsive CopG/Arc/MetJ family transcriptional regulator